MINEQQNTAKTEQKNCKDYLLYSNKTAISSQRIEELLFDKDCRVLTFDTIDSTNLYLKKLAEDGANEKTIVVANHQTNGKGRLGRSFYSPADSGIYFSILLKPNIELKNAVNVTTCAGVAMCLTLEKMFGIKPKIKWVNDIFVNDKKVCGILTEAAVDSDTNKPKYVVLGVGCNLFVPKDDFPTEISDIAGSVVQSKENSIADRNAVIAHFLNVFFELCASLGSSEIYEMYKERMFLLGQKVKVMSSEQFEAEIIDINPDFSLKLKLENGEIFNLNTGEVSVRSLSV